MLPLALHLTPLTLASEPIVLQQPLLPILVLPIGREVAEAHLPPLGDVVKSSHHNVGVPGTRPIGVIEMASIGEAIMVQQRRPRVHGVGPRLPERLRHLGAVGLHDGEAVGPVLGEERRREVRREPWRKHLRRHQRRHHGVQAPRVLVARGRRCGGGEGEEHAEGGLREGVGGEKEEERLLVRLGGGREVSVATAAGERGAEEARVGSGGAGRGAESRGAAGGAGGCGGGEGAEAGGAEGGEGGERGRVEEQRLLGEDDLPLPDAARREEPASSAGEIGRTQRVAGHGGAELLPRRRRRRRWEKWGFFWG